MNSSFLLQVLVATTKPADLIGYIIDAEKQLTVWKTGVAMGDAGPVTLR